VYAFLEKTTLKADIIFADPPYHFETEKFLQIVDIVFDKEMIADEGLLIIEHSKNTDLSQHKNHSYDKRYGGNVFSFFEYNNEENSL
jgi:16S rRNA G966 N2-methylase RsmD